MKEDSHIADHRQEDHLGAGFRDLFEFKVISKEKTSFARQIAEAVEIMSFSSGTLLNKKEMFNRSLIPEIFMKGPENKLQKKDHTRRFQRTVKGKLPDIF